MRSARKCGTSSRRTNGIHEGKTTQFYGLLMPKAVLRIKLELFRTTAAKSQFVLFPELKKALPVQRVHTGDTRARRLEKMKQMLSTGKVSLP